MGDGHVPEKLKRAQQRLVICSQQVEQVFDDGGEKISSVRVSVTAQEASTARKG